LPRRAAPGGLQRLRHPTSQAILHRACASKAPHTPPPTLSLPFPLRVLYFLTLYHFILHSRLASPTTPRRLVVSPFAHTSRGTLRFVESAFRGSLLASFAKGEECSIPPVLRYQPPLPIVEPSPSSRPFLASPLLFVFPLYPGAMCSRALTRSLLSRLIYSAAPALRGFVPVISTMETKSMPERGNLSIYDNPVRAMLS